MLRLLLDDSCKDWYLSMLIKNTVESDWSIWVQSLKETYADKGWSPIKYALNFKYLKDTDIEKIEMLRLLLDDSCKDWYLSMLIKNTVESDWSMWVQCLKETYADKGWSPIKYALNFKYLKGSILDYALRKERLLLEVNSSINKSLLIDMIAVGLPNFVTDKIDREKLKEVDDIFNKLRGLKHLIKENNSNKNAPVDNK